MYNPCKTCESTEFNIDNFERICTNCGDVQEDEGRLCMLPDNEAVVDNFRHKNIEANQRLTDRIRGETNSSDTKRQICRAKLMDELLKVVRQIVKHPSAVEETMDLIGSALQAHKGRLLKNKKLGIVGACIYYVSAKHQLGISLTVICKFLNIRLKIISFSLKHVRELCPNLEYERPNIKDLVKKFIDEIASKTYDLSSLEPSPSSPNDREVNERKSQPLIDLKDRVVLQNRVMLLIELFEAMHPYNQPTPQSLITAVVYHAWRSLDTFKMIAINLSSISSSYEGSSSTQDVVCASRNLASEEEPQITQVTPANAQIIKVKHSITFEKFCQICNLKLSSNGYKIVSKLQSSMLMLGKYLGDVNKINLPWYLKDIIENSPHLIQEHMRTEPSSKILNR